MRKFVCLSKTTDDLRIYDDIQIDQYDDLAENFVGQFLDQLPHYGDLQSEKIWVLIARYHAYPLTEEELDSGVIPNEIDAVFHVNTREEVSMLMRSIQIFNEDLADSINRLEDSGLSDSEIQRVITEWEKHDPIELIFMDELQRLSQLQGNLYEVPSELRRLFLEPNSDIENSDSENSDIDE